MATNSVTKHKAAHSNEIFKCDVEGCAFEHKNPSSLGVHRRFVHGIVSVKNQAKEAKLKAKHKAKNQEYLQNGESKPPEFYEAATNKRRSHEADTLALITVGRITYLTEEVASKYGVSKDAFTKRCAELFYASQVRQ